MLGLWRSFHYFIGEFMGASLSYWIIDFRKFISHSSLFSSDLQYHSKIHCISLWVNQLSYRKIQNQQWSRSNIQEHLLRSFKFIAGYKLEQFCNIFQSQTCFLTSFMFGFRLWKYTVNLLKHFKISLNDIKLKLDIQIFNWKLYDIRVFFLSAINKTREYNRL